MSLTRILFVILSAAFAGYLSPTAGFSQAASNPGSTPPPPVVSTAAVAPISDVSVLAAKSAADTSSARLEEIIVLEVKNLKDLQAHAGCKSSTGADVPNCVKQQIALFLDGREIEGLAPESATTSGERQFLRFHLKRTSANDEAWADILGAPPLDRETFFTRRTAVSAGFAKGSALPSIVDSGLFSIRRMDEFWFRLCSFFVGVFVLAGLYLAMRTELLRDAGPDPVGTVQGWVFSGKARRPYSLARCQMAFWFALVIPSYLFIWLTTGDFNTITAGVLALIGIGGGTLLGSAVIDVSSRQRNETELRALEAEAQALDAAIANLDQLIASAPANVVSLNGDRAAKAQRQEIVATRIAALETATAAQASDWFLMDLLSDRDGISFHRFQMLVWTLVLGILFVYQTWFRLSMPNFDATLLALMGISAGTYLGFKIPEKQV